MDQQYKSAASKLEEILKNHKRELSKDETSLSALIKELKDGIPGTIDVETKFKVLEDALKKNQPVIWKRIKEIRNSLATDSTGTVRTETSTAAPEPKARAFGDSEIGFLEESFRVIIEILETNSATEPFPEPDERQKEKLGECYKYALKVANLCKKRESDLQHAYQIIGDICNQVMEVDVDQLQEISEKPTTTSFKKASEGTGSTVPKKTKHDGASELDKKGRTASPGLKKTDATSSSMKVHEEKGHVVQNKREPNIAQKIEMKIIAVLSAIKKMKDTKGYLEGAAKIIQELYRQVMEVNDDHAQEKPETLIATSSMKVTEDTGHTGPTKTEPDIAKELEMKGIAVAAALKKMKDTKGDLERASKIIEDLHSHVMEDTVNQAQAEPEKPTTEPKKGDDNTGHPIPPKTVPHMTPNLEKKGTARSSSRMKMKDTTTSSKKVTQDNEHTVPKTTEPTITNELEMKGLAVSITLKKMKDTKGDLERASKIIHDLYNQVMDVTDDQEKTEPLMTTSSKRGSNDTGQTTPKKIEPDFGKDLEMKGAEVSEALKNMKDTKGDLERVSKIIENLHNQVMDVKVDRAQEEPETPMTTRLTTRLKKGGVDTGSTVSKKSEPDMTPKLEMRDNAALSGLKRTIETEHTVPVKIDPDTARTLEIKGEAVNSALQQMQDMKGQVKTLKKENDFLVQLLDALHESIVGVEQKTSKNKPSAAPGTAPTRHEITSKILRTFQEKKNEAEYAACLLEELSNFSHATSKDDNGSILSSPQNVETSQDFKEKDAKNVDNSRQKTPQFSHDENLMKSYRYASHVLKDMKECERLRIDLGKKKGHIEDLMERLKNIQDENTTLMKEADSLRTRLSEHAGALLHHDNPAIADLSDPNRATKLGEKYLELYDNQWTDAFTKLQTEYSSASDEELTGYLYKLLVDGYAFCTDARHAQRFNLQEIMLNPTGDVTKSQIRPKEEVSKSFSNLLSDAAKLSSNVASGNIAKAFVKNEGTKIKHGKMIKLCKTYIQECVQLCWYMQVQTPPLCLDLSTTKGHAFEKNKYKEYTTRGKKIAFVVWPALFLHANGPLLSKGVAQGDLTPKQAAEV